MKPINNKIKEIHESNLYGIILETTCIDHKLMQVAGASNTIADVRKIYSKDLQKHFFGEFSRSVSMEMADNLLKEGKHELEIDNKLNFILSSTFQLNEENANGWLGLYIKQTNTKYFFHFSFTPNTDLSRIRLLDEISNIGVEILHKAIKDKFDYIHSEYAILDQAYINDMVNYDLLLNTLEKSKNDYFLVFEELKPIRFIDVMRRVDASDSAFIIEKGSFSPAHVGHTRTMKMSMDKYPNSVGIFMTSIYRYDKPTINTQEIIEKIININYYGYPFIVYKSKYFYDTFNLLNIWNKGNNKKFLFVIGSDVINRIFITDFDFINKWNIDFPEFKMDIKNYINSKIQQYKNFKFLLFNRKDFIRNEETHLYDEMIIENNEYKDDGISSTQIRNEILKDKI